VSSDYTDHAWAVRVHADRGGIPGPWILECSSEQVARQRLAWWQQKRPDARPELLQREIVVTAGPWTLAGPHPTCIDVTAIDQPPRSAWICGPDCPKEA
jgi:hypothetical protein